MKFFMLYPDEFQMGDVFLAGNRAYRVDREPQPWISGYVRLRGKNIDNAACGSFEFRRDTTHLILREGD